MTLELSRMSGKDHAPVIRIEAASCIKIAALKQKIASAATIRRQVRERKGSHFKGDSGEVSTNVHVFAGRVWFTQAVGSRAKRLTGPVQPGQARHVVQSGGYYLVYNQGHTRGWRLPDPIWLEFLATEDGREEYIKALIAERTARRGIERLSWLQMGDAIGIDLETVAPSGALQQPIARAAAVRGRQYKNGAAIETATGSRFILLVTNESPAAIKRFGQIRLNNAVEQRVRGFEIALGKGLLQDLERRAARWPGIFVRPL